MGTSGVVYFMIYDIVRINSISLVGILTKFLLLNRYFSSETKV